MSQRNQLEFMNEAAKNAKGKKGFQEAYEEAINKAYDKKFPVIPNAKKGSGGGVPLVHKTIIRKGDNF